MAETTFMFGVGATKAGTSWLYQYMQQHPDCHMPGFKELHYFDAIDNGKLKRERVRIVTMRKELVAKRKVAGAAQAVRLAMRIKECDQWLALLRQDVEDVAGYSEFMTARAGMARLVGDITPSYALLSEERLARMAQLAPRVRFVYLLRDPIDRLWSNVRMMATRTKSEPEAAQAEALRIFDRFVAGQDVGLTGRSDYAGALGRMNRALRPEDVFVAFYEELFSDTVVSRLCAFLGIAFRPGAYDKVEHGGVPMRLDDGRRSVARRLLAPQYEQVQELLGELPARWQTNRMEPK